MRISSPGRYSLDQLAAIIATLGWPADNRPAAPRPARQVSSALTEPVPAGSKGRRTWGVGIRPSTCRAPLITTGLGSAKAAAETGASACPQRRAVITSPCAQAAASWANRWVARWAEASMALVPQLGLADLSHGVALTEVPLHRGTNIAYRSGAGSHPAVTAITAALRSAVPDELGTAP